MNRIALGVLALLLIRPDLCFADLFLLKSGQSVTGKLVEKKADRYIVSVPGRQEPVELPVNQVSIADIDPASETAPKGTLSLLTGPDADGVGKPRNDNPAILVPSHDNLAPEVPNLAKNGVLKKAQDTVKLSNERTAQSVDEISKMKDIADSANSG